MLFSFRDKYIVKPKPEIESENKASRQVLDRQSSSNMGPEGRLAVTIKKIILVEYNP